MAGLLNARRREVILWQKLLSKLLVMWQGRARMGMSLLQVLHQFAPTQLATGDAAGASKMLTSGVTLARSLNDLPTQVSGQSYLSCQVLLILGSQLCSNPAVS